MKITSIATNPYRPSSGRYIRFTLYKVGMTPADYIAAGGSEKAFKRDVASGSIMVDVPVDREPLERPARRSPRSTGKKTKGQLRSNAMDIQPHDYGPEDHVPVSHSDFSSKLTSTLERYWVFAYQEDGARWRLKQEIYSWGEADGQMRAVNECKYIQPQWWDFLGGGT
jgi:hypothetical protein